MDLRTFATEEASAFAERLIGACEAVTRQAREEASTARNETQRELAAMRESLDATRNEESRLARALEEESARTVSLEQAHNRAIQDYASRLAEAEAAQASLRSEAQAAEAALRDEMQATEALIRSEAQAAESTLLGQLAHAATAVQTLREELRAAQRDQQTLEEQVRQLEGRQRDLDAEAAALRQQAQEAEAGASAIRAELDTLTIAGERTASLLTASIHAMDALARPGKVEDVLRTVVDQLGRHFDRTAIFGVHGKHLQGAHGTGIDASLDVTKLMLPMGIDTLMTRALASGATEHLHDEQLAELRPPFGGHPVSALAIPIVFADDTLAILYADSQTKLTDAHVAFATLIARHTSAVLARLAQELKTVRELREYARTLVEEAEQMFEADLEAGRPGPERVRRLRSSIEFARQLFDHRTASERVVVAGLLDEHISAIVAGDTARPFSRDLALALDQPEMRRATAS